MRTYLIGNQQFLSPAKSIGIILTTLLLSSVNLPVFAGQGWDRDGRDGNRGQTQEQRGAPRQDRNGEFRDGERSNAPQQRYSEQPQQQQQNLSDQSRHGGRMSAEDRRALRQQIDQAGHDIYQRSR
jgi:hypothetical protein